MSEAVKRIIREKREMLVITFHTTADAMAFENACRKRQFGERLIPVPREISAGCGMAWCAREENRGAMEQLLEEAGIESDGIHVCMV